VVPRQPPRPVPAPPARDVRPDNGRKSPAPPDDAFSAEDEASRPMAIPARSLRQQMFDTPAVAPPVIPSTPPPAYPDAPVSKYGWVQGTTSGKSWDEKLGPIGIIGIAAIICVLAFVLALQLHLF